MDNISLTNNIEGFSSSFHYHLLGLSLRLQLAPHRFAGLVRRNLSSPLSKRHLKQIRGLKGVLGTALEIVGTHGKREKLVCWIDLN